MKTIILFLIVAAAITGCGNSEIKPGITTPHLKGFMAATVYTSLKEKGYSMDRTGNGKEMMWFCDKKIEGADYNVRIAGASGEEVEEIKASITTDGRKSLNDLAAPFLGFIATANYEGSSPDEAKKWVIENISKTVTKEFGGVKFEVIANNEFNRMLIITPQ